MKPRVSYADLQWHQAFARLKDLPQGTKLTADGIEFTLHSYLDDPHPPSLWLKVRVKGKKQTYICRRGDPLLLALTPC